MVSVVLAFACCVTPYSLAKQAYANPLVLTASEAAFAAVCAVLGISVASNEDAKALYADWELYTEDIDALAASVSAMQDVAIEAGTANGTLVNATKQQVSQSEIDAINVMLDAAGKAGSFALDQLCMVKDGVLGIFPFILSSFFADQVSSPSIGQTFFLDIGASLPPITFTDGFPIGDRNKYYAYYLDSAGRKFVFGTSNSTAIGLCLFGSSSAGYYLMPSVSPASDFTVSPAYVDENGKTRTDVLKTYNDIRHQLAAGLICSTTFKTITVNDYTGQSVFGKGVTYVNVYENGAWNTSIGTLTDNPDVIGGSDYWQDAKDQVDVLNPAAGAAVIGSDLVIDGDYVANRGSIAIPTDWSGVTSWADALAKTNAGVAQGALDGTISGATTGTAVNVGTGELVTDKVGELVKPGANTSVTPVSPVVPGLFDGVIDSVSGKFPFCIPADLHKCLVALSAPPVAPAFDWVFSLHHVGLQDVTIHVDLSPFDSVAMILRVCLSVTMTIGLIFLSIRLLNMWGGD